VATATRSVELERHPRRFSSRAQRIDPPLRSCLDVMESSGVLEGTGPVTITRFEEFFEAEHVRLARALYLLTGSAPEADELTQEAMVRVYERWDRVRQMGSPQGYLFRTALNLHRSRLRWLASRARQILQPTRSPDPAEVVQSRDSLDRALASLPTGQRGAVVLVEWLGMDPQEAATALGIKPGSVRARLSRARAALRRMLEDEDA
jgi:RNA polymerase sigma-70 factor (ECF subfamily)